MHVANKCRRVFSDFSSQPLLEVLGRALLYGVPPSIGMTVPVMKLEAGQARSSANPLSTSIRR